MKLFVRYLNSRRGAIAFGAVICVIYSLVIVLYRLPVSALICPLLPACGVGAGAAAVDFFRVKRQLAALSVFEKNADIITLPLPKARSLEGESYRAVCERMRESYLILTRETDARYRDTVEYYTTWAHQVKTPIAAMRLALQREDTPSSRALSADLTRIEKYADMVMTYLRLDGVSDYLFERCDIDAVIRRAASAFAAEFIGRGIKLNITPSGAQAVTDKKWLGFVIEQLISNALKYTELGYVKIGVENGDTIYIEDSGIGILPQDLPRVFEKGYTGCTGHADRHSSGIGLYLCGRICKNLGADISLSSEPGRGTTARVKLNQYKL